MFPAGIVACLWLGSVCPLPSQPARPPLHESQVKAALIYNFAKFVDWPDEAPAAGPIGVVVLGDPALTANLSETLRDKTVRGRGFQVRPSTTPESLALCHIVFVASQDRAEVERVLHLTIGTPTLTIGELSGFSDWGGIIELVVDNNKFRFEINAGMARMGGLKLSSRLLRLARAVKGN